MATLKGIYADGCSFVTIGRAGEFEAHCGQHCLHRIANCAPSRHAGRGGVGAVMGAKGLKSIIINPLGGEIAPSSDVEAFSGASRRFAKALAENPITGKRPGRLRHGHPGQYRQRGRRPADQKFRARPFPRSMKTSPAKKMNELTAKRGGEGKVAHGCMSGCVIRCSGLYPGKDGKLIGKWPEYETIWGFGPHSEIDDLDLIAHFDYLCDDYGVDNN